MNSYIFQTRVQVSHYALLVDMSLDELSYELCCFNCKIKLMFPTSNSCCEDEKEVRYLNRVTLSAWSSQHSLFTFPLAKEAEKQVQFGCYTEGEG